MILIVNFRESDDHHGRVAHRKEEALRELIQRGLQPLFENVLNGEPALLAELQVFIALRAGQHEEAPVLHVLAGSCPATRFENSVQNFRGHGLARHVRPNAPARLDELVDVQARPQKRK